jgi:hypothetical protein
MRLALLIPFALAAVACDKTAFRDPSDTRSADSAFAAVQSRGQRVMGVDQATSSHVFEDLADGGRIVLERDDASDTAAIGMIRRHMRQIAVDFSNGDFSKPFAVHATEIPGSKVLASLRSAITYGASDLPRGAEVRITTTNAQAITAVHAFLAFQRSEHHAAGHQHPDG